MVDAQQPLPSNGRQIAGSGYRREFTMTGIGVQDQPKYAPRAHELMPPRASGCIHANNTEAGHVTQRKEAAHHKSWRVRGTFGNGMARDVSSSRSQVSNGPHRALGQNPGDKPTVVLTILDASN